MINISVLFSQGFEEAEALTIVDILRRAGFNAVITGIDSRKITGGHNITVHADLLLEDVLKAEGDYSMLVLPGGYEGVINLLKNPDVIGLVKSFDNKQKFVAAICAAPLVLEEAGILEGRKFTAYPGYDKKILSGTFLENTVIRDENLITGRGPASVYAFSYALIDALGGDSKAVKERMVYHNSFREAENG